MADFNVFNPGKYRFRPFLKLRWMRKPWPHFISSFRGANFLQVYMWHFDICLGMPWLKAPIWSDGWDAHFRVSHGIHDKTPDLP